MGTYNQSSILVFEDIWLYSQPSKRTGTFFEREKWLSKITSKTMLAEPLSGQRRALIAGAHGRLLPNEVTVMTGASGCGKSVLLRLLAGLSSMTTGNIWLKERSIHDVSAMDWRAQVALLAQHPQLLEGRVLDNLQMPYRLQSHQHSHFDIDWHIEQLAYLERGADFLQQNTSYLSGGERQLVNTLRLLQLNPQVLLLDEPTAALDPDTSSKLVHMLINWLHAKPERTLLWVTHDTQDIMPLANKHWHMQAGVLTELN